MITYVWHVYLVRCSDDSLYTGCTNDLPARLATHNAGKGARYTRSRRPVTLAWSRAVKDRSRALSVEATIKRFSRAQKQAIVGSNQNIRVILGISKLNARRRQAARGRASLRTKRPRG